MTESLAGTPPQDTGVHDNTEALVRMANQIAQFFASHRHEEGVAGVAAHVNQFWDPRMRRRFLAAAETHRDRLHPLAAEALPQIRR
jgi:formate dehydrogenase subunit delta